MHHMLFLFLGIFFSFARGSVNFSNDGSDEIGSEKAFRIICEPGTNQYGTCVYSVKFAGKLPANRCEGTAKITINGVGDPFTVDSLGPPNSQTVNFEVNKGDEVVLYFDPKAGSGSDTTCVYGIYDQPNGSGTALINNQFTNFNLYNPCASSCTYILKKISPSSWPQNANITITVNNNTTQFFNGSSISFSVNKGDSINFKFLTASGTGGNKVAIETQTAITIFTWLQDGYFSPMTFTNPCNKIPFPPSPFSGKLYPITNEEIEAFLEDLSSPSLWVPITSPDTVDSPNLLQ